MVSKNTKRILWYVRGEFSPSTIKEAVDKGYSLRDARYFNETSMLETCEAVLGEEFACERYRKVGVKVIEQTIEEKPKRKRRTKFEMKQEAQD